MNLLQDFKMVKQVLIEQQWMFFYFLHTVGLLSFIYFHKCVCVCVCVCVFSCLLVSVLWLWICKKISFEEKHFILQYVKFIVMRLTWVRKKTFMCFRFYPARLVSIRALFSFKKIRFYKDLFILVYLSHVLIKKILILSPTESLCTLPPLEGSVIQVAFMLTLYIYIYIYIYIKLT